jgi:hypothetical protein
MRCSQLERAKGAATFLSLSHQSCSKLVIIEFIVIEPTHQNRNHISKDENQPNYPYGYLCVMMPYFTRTYVILSPRRQSVHAPHATV